MTANRPDTMLAALSVEARARLEELARRNDTTTHDLALRFLEGAIAADALEEHLLRLRIAKADAGGPFNRHQDVLDWLEALSRGEQPPMPTASLHS